MSLPAFLTLSLELRNQIYSHVFACASIQPTLVANNSARLFLNPPPSRKDPFHGKSDPQTILALLLVNHQISAEAAASFYSNTLFVGTTEEITQFVGGIGVQRAELLRRLVINTSVDQIHDGILHQLILLRGLRSVRIVAYEKHFELLREGLVQAGILEFTGRLDFSVENTWNGDLDEYDVSVRSDDVEGETGFTDTYLWGCWKGESEWVGGERIRTVN